MAEYFERNPIPPGHPDTRVLDDPPCSFAHVLLWSTDLGINPSQERWNEGRRLPPGTTLAEVLKFLGADLTAYGR